MARLDEPSSWVSMNVGDELDPLRPLGDPEDVTLRAFGLSGELVGEDTVTVVNGGGFAGILEVDSTSTNILRFEVFGQSSTVKRLAIDNLSFNVPHLSAPDFIIEMPDFVSILAGGPPVDVPIVIHRLGGSMGPISLALDPCQSGETCSITPNPVLGNTATLRLQLTPEIPQFHLAYTLKF